MKYLSFLILTLFLLSTSLFAQQINYTWGQSAAGATLTQTGFVNVDSISTITVVFDMQDYYFVDLFPAIYDSATALLNSNRLYYGTLWYKVDVQNAADSSKFSIYAYPGNMIYHPNDGSRVTATNLNFSTTATVIVDSVADTYATNDIQWTAVNLYLSDAEGKILPPEFIKVFVDFYGTTNDSIDFQYTFAYPALYEYQQSMRHSTRSIKSARKDQETLH